MCAYSHALLAPATGYDDIWQKRLGSSALHLPLSTPSFRVLNFRQLTPIFISCSPPATRAASPERRVGLFDTAVGRDYGLYRNIAAFSIGHITREHPNHMIFFYGCGQYSEGISRDGQRRHTASFRATHFPSSRVYIGFSLAAPKYSSFRRRKSISLVYDGYYMGRSWSLINISLFLREALLEPLKDLLVTPARHNNI